MFLSLLLATFLVSTGVALTVALLFRPSMERILERIIADEIASAWLRYMIFAILVVGISTGVRIWDLEKYIDPNRLPSPGAGVPPLTLNLDRWVLEIYRTVIGTLQGVAWLLLVFFVFALIGFVAVRLGEMKFRKEKGEER